MTLIGDNNMYLNNVILGGNLTADPTYVSFQNNSGVAKFTIALNRKYKDSNSQIQTETSFVDCECFGNNGQNLKKYLEKGRSVVVSGRLKQERWEDSQTKTKRNKLILVVDSWQFADSKGSNSIRTHATTKKSLQPASVEETFDSLSGTDLDESFNEVLTDIEIDSI